jgi:hypothetical protein
VKARVLSAFIALAVFAGCTRKTELRPSYVGDLYAGTMRHLWVLLTQADAKLADGADREAYFVFFDYWLVTLARTPRVAQL